jgi:hypothetical protein
MAEVMVKAIQGAKLRRADIDGSFPDLSIMTGRTVNLHLQHVKTGI